MVRTYKVKHFTNVVMMLDLHQTVMRLHTMMILIIWTLQLFKHPPFPGKMSCILSIRTPTFEIIILISKHLHLAELERGSSNFYYCLTVSVELQRGLPNVF